MKKFLKILLIVFGSIIVFVGILLFFAFVVTPVKAQPKNIDTISWMNNIDDNKKLSSLSIPGTHDSGAYRGGLLYQFGKNQDLTIENQLKVGARFFDLRLGFKGDELYIYHGFFNEKVKFSNVLDSFKSFLNEYSSETILMCIKKEHGEDLSDELMKIINEYNQNNLFYLKDDNPTLGEIRGKIVLFRRFSYSSEAGINLYDGFVDNATFDITSNKYSNIHIQDYYNFEKEEMDTEWIAIKDCIDYCSESGEDELIINFTSGYYSLVKFTALPLNRATSDYVHPRFIDYVKQDNMKEKKLGIVLFDFIDEEIAKTVYERNYE